MKIGDYKLTKGKRNKGKDNWFLTLKDMAEMKLDEAIAHSTANREGKKLAGVYQTPCSCGAEGCSYTRPLEDSNVSVPKKEKGTPTRRRKYSKMSGYVPGDTTIYKRSELDSILAKEKK